MASLSPSQFAFFMRDRLRSLLRLEYLLITGGGSSWTLREVIKTSNNKFKRWGRGDGVGRTLGMEDAGCYAVAASVLGRDTNVGNPVRT